MENSYPRVAAQQTVEFWECKGRCFGGQRNQAKGGRHFAARSERERHSIYTNDGLVKAGRDGELAFAGAKVNA